MNARRTNPFTWAGQRPLWRWYALACTGTAAISLLLWELARFGQPGEQAYFYLLLVLLVAYRGGRGPGIFTSVLSALALHLIASSGTGTPTLLGPAEGAASLPDNSMDLAIFLVVSVVMSYLSAREAGETRRATRRASELDTILENLTDAVLIADAAGLVVKANAAAIRLLGLTQTRDALVPLSTYPGRFGLSPEADAPDVLTGMQTFRETPYLLTQPGRPQVYLTLSGTPLFDPEGQADGVAVVIHDMSTLRETRRQRDEFVAITAHELKTPVTSLKGYAQLAGRMLRKGDVTAIEPSLRRLQESAERLSTLVDRLVEYARLSQEAPLLDRSQHDLVSLVQDVVEATSRVVSTHQLVVEPNDPPRLTCHCDGDRLQQALGHLVGNAVRYSPTGSMITLSITRQDGAALLALRDQGIGIPTQEQERVFQPFVRGSNADSSYAGGLGMGLYISKRIVEGHGGSIRVHSEEGSGTTVYVSLPLYETAAA